MNIYDKIVEMNTLKVISYILIYCAYMLSK